MRLIIEIDGMGERQASVTADTVAGGSTSASDSATPTSSDAQSFGDAINAGSPTGGVPLGAPAETAIGGQAIDAGAAPPTAAGGEVMSSALAWSSSTEELIDAGGASDID